MVHEATFLLEYEGEEQARRVAESIRPEVDDVDGDRTWVELRREGAMLEILIEADDPVALRAGINTWLSLASVAERAGGVESGGVSSE